MRLMSPVSFENLMQSRLGERGLKMLAVQVIDKSLKIYNFRFCEFC